MQLRHVLDLPPLMLAHCRLLLWRPVFTIRAAYEPVDRNFDAVELSAECDIAYVDVVAAELQARACHVQRARSHARHSASLHGCSP